MKIHSGPIILDPDNHRNDKYDIVGLICEGRTFRIFKARYGTKYVILKSPVFTDTMSVEILRREYELCRFLSHPCIVSTIGFEEDSPVGPAIVLEFIDGLTLDEFIAHGATVSERKSVLKDILEGVDYLHHRGILHNDLKPDNIIVNANGAARIIDFGLSGSEDSVYKGIIGGSDGYSAPEILHGEGPSGATSDIFSIGLLIRLLWGGRRYDSIAKKCCRPNPADRFPSIGALRSSISRRNHLPLICAGIVAACSIAILAFLPTINEIAAELKFERIKERIALETDAFYKPALDSIMKQDNKKSAEAVRQNYYSRYMHYLDSLEKVHPMQADGAIPPEIVAASEIIRAQWNILDSVTLSLQSKTLLIE